MPHLTGEGVKLYKDDICGDCHHLLICNVYSDLRLDGESSKYNESHIVKPGETKDRSDYYGCRSFQEYVPMNDRKDQDPTFGQRMSQQEYNRYQGVADDTPRRLIN